jgi:serine/threonine-protein kinase
MTRAQSTFALGHPTQPASVEIPQGLALPGVGAVIGERYRITRLIGAGGMGTVFEAETLNLGRRCAIKFLRSERAARSYSCLRFERDARLLARLEHEHLTT